MQTAESIDTRLKYALIHAESYRVKGVMRALTSRHGSVSLETMDRHGDDPAQLWTVSPNGFIRSDARDNLFLSPSQGCVSVSVSLEKPDTPWTIVPVGDHPMKVRLLAAGCGRQRVLRASFISFAVDLEEDGFEMDASAWYLAPLHAIRGLRDPVDAMVDS